MIYIPKIYGTCNGAQNAIDTVNKLYEQKNKKIVVYKELLHNQKVMENLKRKNVECINNLENIDKDTIVVIRSHGEGEDTYKYLNNNNIEYSDATCKNVLKIHDIIKEKYYQNYDIIIIGKKEKNGDYHPEVSGSNGWCQNKAKIIDSLLDVDDLEINKENVLVICQTTFNEQLAISIATKIKEKLKNKNVEFINTICNAQKLIQKYAVELAKKMDYMIIIGGQNSSNTEELYKLCATICPSIKISTMDELLDWLKKNKINYNTKIGITGGASTPKSEIIDYKNLIEFYLFYCEEKNVFEQEITNYNQKFLNSKDNSIVYDAIQKLINVNQGGKYLRATLISLGYKLMSNKADQSYLPLALAYETFQTSILIHDDIIDEADTRRGKDTIPTIYEKEFTNKNNKIGNHIANSLGVCIGDLGFYFANKIILDNYQQNDNICKILTYYNDIVINTIKGEIIDVKLPYDIQYGSKKDVTEDDILEIYRLKTAWYTIIGPFNLGCLLANTNDKEIQKFETILEKIGLAFQIKDDIIGIFGNAKYIGKSTNSDISEFKQTIMYSYIHNHNQKFLTTLNKYYGKKNITKVEIEKVKQIFIESKALEYAQNMMNQLFDDSIKTIENLTIDDKYKNILLGFIHYLKIRQK